MFSYFTRYAKVRPYVCGWEINVVEYETDSRIRHGWMEDLFRFYSIPFIILIVTDWSTNASDTMY
jgi:hypothetical protein